MKATLSVSGRGLVALPAALRRAIGIQPKDIYQDVCAPSLKTLSRTVTALGKRLGLELVDA